MKLYGWEKVGSSDEYREMIKAEYYRLKRQRQEDSQGLGMEEVKLRLFLSLLDRPSAGPQNNQEKDSLNSEVSDVDDAPLGACANQ